MDVHGGHDHEGRNIIVWNKHNGINQQWDIVYADLPPPKVSFKPNTPFVIINQMAGKRLLTVNGSNFEVRARDNSPDQVFMYDPVSSTIKTYANQ